LIPPEEGEVMPVPDAAATTGVTLSTSPTCSPISFRKVRKKEKEQQTLEVFPSVRRHLSSVSSILCQSPEKGMVSLKGGKVVPLTNPPEGKKSFHRREPEEGEQYHLTRPALQKRGNDDRLFCQALLLQSREEKQPVSLLGSKRGRKEEKQTLGVKPHLHLSFASVPLSMIPHLLLHATLLFEKVS
jgi:hypothetical protein